MAKKPRYIVRVSLTTSEKVRKADVSAAVAGHLWDRVIILGKAARFETVKVMEVEEK